MPAIHPALEHLLRRTAVDLPKDCPGSAWLIPIEALAAEFRRMEPIYAGLERKLEHAGRSAKATSSTLAGIRAWLAIYDAIEMGGAPVCPLCHSEGGA